MYRLYDYPLSGNCYKVRLALAQLDLPHQLIDVDIRAPDGREVIPPTHPCGGRVPLLELPDATSLGESNAILYFLAENSALWPSERFERARALQWMFFEQNQIEPNIGTARYWISIRKQPELRSAQIPGWHQGGLEALKIVDRHLEEHDYFAGERYTIADIAVYGYTHVAAAGGFDLAPFPALGTWFERVRAQPGHIPMQ